MELVVVMGMFVGAWWGGRWTYRRWVDTSARAALQRAKHDRG